MKSSLRGGSWTPIIEGVANLAIRYCVDVVIRFGTTGIAILILLKTDIATKNGIHNTYCFERHKQLLTF